MRKTATAHIWLDAEGRAWIDDTKIKVIEVVLDRVTYEWSPEAIHIQHPSLSLAQIHAALSYYYDHQAEFEAQIARDLQEVQALRASQVMSPSIQQKLRQAGKKL